MVGNDITAKYLAIDTNIQTMAVFKGTLKKSFDINPDDQYLITIQGDVFGDVKELFGQIQGNDIMHLAVIGIIKNCFHFNTSIVESSGVQE